MAVPPALTTSCRLCSPSDGASLGVVRRTRASLFQHGIEVCHPAGDSLGGELWSKHAYALVREHGGYDEISNTLLRNVTHASDHVLEMIAIDKAA